MCDEWWDGYPYYDVLLKSLIGVRYCVYVSGLDSSQILFSNTASVGTKGWIVDFPSFVDKRGLNKDNVLR